jgi:hypothetical protein
MKFANLEIVKLSAKDKPAATKAATISEVILIVDVSGSMWGKTGSVEGSTSRMLGALEARGSRISVINYDSAGSMKVQYEGAKASDVQNLAFMPRGMTSPSQALKWAAPRLKPGVAVVLHTDGWFNDPSARAERDAAFAFADAVKASGATLVAVAHGDGADGATLLEMASRAGGMFVADSGRSVFQALETAVTVVESRGTTDTVTAPDGWLLLNTDNELGESVKHTKVMWKLRRTAESVMGLPTFAHKEKWSKSLVTPVTHVIKAYAAAMDGVALTSILNAGFWSITGGTRMLTKNVMFRLNQDDFDLILDDGPPKPDIMELLTNLKGQTVLFKGTELKRRSLFEAEEELPYMPEKSEAWTVVGHKVASASVTVELMQTVPLVDRKSGKRITIMGIKPVATLRRSLQVISAGEIQDLPLYQYVNSTLAVKKIDTSAYSFGSSATPIGPTRAQVVALYREKFYDSAFKLWNANNAPPAVTKDLEGLKAKEVDGEWVVEWRGGTRTNPYKDRKAEAVSKGWIDTYTQASVSFGVNGWSSVENQPSAAAFLKDWYGVAADEFRVGFVLPERKVRPRATWAEQQDMMLASVLDIIHNSVPHTFATKVEAQKMNLLALELSALGTVPWGVVEEGKGDTLIYKLGNGVSVTLVEKSVEYTTSIGMENFYKEKV